MARRSRPRKVTYFEPVSPRLARNTPQPLRGAGHRVVGDGCPSRIVGGDRATVAVAEGMRAERKAFDRTFAGLSRRDDVTRRLMTIPGVGSVTRLAFRATIDESDRFTRSKALGAHLGLTPRVYQSGEIDRAGHTSKCGDRMLRHLLYEAASVQMTRTRKWSRLRAWGVSVAKRRGMKRATVAVARKLAVIMHCTWVTGGEFEFGSPATTATAA